MSIQTKTMTVKSDTSLAETTTTIRDTVTFDVSNMPNGITYKGLKAVLSFADPIQWNKASSYDSLTVVWDDASHGSYASKRPVPPNIELTNEFYWLRTADLDAQVEIYRQEVRELNKRVTANTDAIASEVARATAAEGKLQTSIENLVKTKIDEYVTLEQFEAVGDGVTDDSESLKRALKTGKTILLGPKKYAIKNDVNIPSNTAIYGGYTNSALVLYDNSLIFNGEDTHHATSLLLNGVTIYSADYPPVGTSSPINPDFSRDLTIPAFKAYCANYINFVNCNLYTFGFQIDLKKVYDSHFINCNFVSGGSNEHNLPSVRLAAFEGSSQNSAYNNTNAIYFNCCRFEGYRNIAVLSVGKGNNTIFFNTCKFESIVSEHSCAIKFIEGSSVFLNQIQTAYRPDATDHNMSFEGTNKVFISNMIVYMWNKNTGNIGEWKNKYPLGFGDSNSKPTNNVHVTGVAYSNAPFNVDSSNIGCAFSSLAFNKNPIIEINGIKFNTIGGRALIKLTPTTSESDVYVNTKSIGLYIVEIKANTAGTCTLYNSLHNTTVNVDLKQGMNAFYFILPPNKTLKVNNYSAAVSADNINFYLAGYGFNGYATRIEY